MKYRHAAIAAAFLMILGAKPASAEPRAVIELFTSQGCSSCPAADKLLGELAEDPSVMTLSLGVDYWDYLGWKDTLALHGHSKRQRAYARARGDREVYTPQIVVNGAVQVLGSDKNAIDNAIDQTRRDATVLSVPVTVTVTDGNVVVNIPAAETENLSGEVWLCPVTGKVMVDIGRGENNGRTITYTNVVRRWVKLGNWSGRAESFTFPVSELASEDYALSDIDRVAVLLQDGVAARPGIVLGAASTKLP